MQHISRKHIATQYIAFLEKGEMENVINLFSENGVVHSPLYGTKSAKDFYTELSGDTNNSELKVKGIFEDEQRNSIALYFNYKWTMADGNTTTFDVVDIVDFNEKNEIVRLTIIYDTVKSREGYKALKG